MADLTLLGYRHSVYTRVLRMVLAEKGLAADYVEVDPFADAVAPELMAANPFGRVPVLRHGDFAIYETAAIARYVDAVWPAPQLCPDAPQAAARMAQVIGIVDAYAYPVLVRQVYSHAVFRPAHGHASDPAILAAGLAGSGRVLGALEEIAAEGVQLAPGTLSLADLHLAPMIAAFAAAAEGRAALARYPHLAEWFERMRNRASFTATEPG